MSEFFSSYRFQAIRDEFYPHALADDEPRWDKYRDLLRPYSQAAEMAAIPNPDRGPYGSGPRNPSAFMRRTLGN